MSTLSSLASKPTPTEGRATRILTNFPFATRLATLVAVIALVLGLAPQAQAQLSTATISGVVTDTTGAAVPNATVTLVQTETNFSRVVTTKADGTYHEEFLPVGAYKITAAAAGFKKLERSGIVLSVMQNAELTLKLDVGGTDQMVEVTADIPLVNLGNATLGRTVSNVEIDNLPLVGRNVYQLLNLTAGVQSNATTNALGFPELHTLINGSTDNFVGQVSYYLDGGLNMTGLRNSGNTIPNPDAISQFNVQTNNFGAQLGRYAAAVVSVVTKSGSNTFHGSAFEFYRTRNFNAVSHNSIVKSPYSRNQFGGTLGGPIRRDKDFFFASYAGLINTTSPAYTGNVPSARQQTGDFSENLPTAAEQASCAVSPSAAAVAAFHFLVCDPVKQTPYPGNIIPSGALDPTAQNILKFLKLTPNPTLASDTPYTHREYAPTPETNREYLIKTDHQITAAHRLTLSYFLLNYQNRVVPSTLTQRWSYSNYVAKQQNANISDIWTLSPRTVNQIWVSYTRQFGGRVAVPGSTTFADFGSDFGISGIPARGQISIANWFTLGQAITGPKDGTNNYGLRDVVSTTLGKHTMYFGLEAGLEKDFQLTSLNNYGVFGFTTGKGVKTTNALSDFLVGIPNSFQQDTGEYAEANYFNYAAFLQDDWKVRPNLTINIGLRYDIQQAPTDTQNRQTNFVPGAQSHAFQTVNISGKTGNQLAPIGLQFPGDPGVPTSGAPTPFNHLSPRIGFAFDPYGTGKSVFHGAVGLFFGGISGNEWEVPSNFAPYAVRPVFSKVTSLTHPYSNDPTEFPGGVNPFPTLTFTPGTSTASFLALNQIVAIDPNYKWPFTYQVNFGFQQQFGNSLSLTANYVGSLNRRLPLYRDINAPVFNINAAGVSGASCTNLALACAYANTAATVNNRRPLNSQYGLVASAPVYSNVYILGSTQTSNYNGLQLNIEKRISHHFSARGFYVWSHTIASNTLNGSSFNGNFVDQNFPQLENHQRSDQDRRNMMTMSWVWTTDYFSNHKLLKAAVNGWTITGIWTANSGQPFTVTTGTDVNGDGQTNDRPSVVPGKAPKVLDNGSSRVAMMSQWFDTSAYCIPGAAGCPGVGPLGLLGTTRSAQLSSPGFRNVDASAFRNFKLYERLNFQIRGEFTNVFNLTNLGAPTTAMNNANFGKITGSGGSNRIIQVGGRILF